MQKRTFSQGNNISLFIHDLTTFFLFLLISHTFSYRKTRIRDKIQSGCAFRTWGERSAEKRKYSQNAVAAPNRLGGASRHVVVFGSILNFPNHFSLLSLQPNTLTVFSSSRFFFPKSDRLYWVRQKRSAGLSKTDTHNTKPVCKQ